MLADQQINLPADVGLSVLTALVLLVVLLLVVRSLIDRALKGLWQPTKAIPSNGRGTNHNLGDLAIDVYHEIRDLRADAEQTRTLALNAYTRAEHAHHRIDTIEGARP